MEISTLSSVYVTVSMSTPIPTFQYHHKKKAPQRFEIGTEEGSQSIIVEDCQRQVYFEVLDLVILRISDRLVMSSIATLKVYWSVQLIVNHLMISLTKLCLSMRMILIHYNYLHSCRISGHFSGNAKKMSLHNCLVALQNFSAQKEFSVYWLGFVA